MKREREGRSILYLREVGSSSVLRARVHIHLLHPAAALELDPLGARAYESVVYVAGVAVG